MVSRHEIGMQTQRSKGMGSFKNPCMVTKPPVILIAFNQEKALVGAFSVIVKTSANVRCELC